MRLLLVLRDIPNATFELPEGDTLEDFVLDLNDSNEQFLAFGVGGRIMFVNKADIIKVEVLQ